jgi:hypothetical protein
LQVSRTRLTQKFRRSSVLKIACSKSIAGADLCAPTDREDQSESQHDSAPPLSVGTDRDCSVTRSFSNPSDQVARQTKKKRGRSPPFFVPLSALVRSSSSSQIEIIATHDLHSNLFFSFVIFFSMFLIDSGYSLTSCNTIATPIAARPGKIHKSCAISQSSNLPARITETMT